MSVEIKHWSGRVLYTAETASDVRVALMAAVLSGAYLSGADLRSADLSRADLSGADLSGADLSGAFLSGAYLSGAYLSGAVLRNAYLSGADLRSADLSGADLSGAYLRNAVLSRADLSRAYLRSADLSRAYLSGADLSRADLSRADLSRADLRDARGVNPYLTTPLHMLTDQPGKIRAYKLVNGAGEGPINGGIVYRDGETIEVDDANTDPAVDCAAGLNVATLDWCITHWRPGYRILLVEFETSDIAAIPHGSDGKFRLHRLTVVGEKNLADIGVQAVTA